jgi:hypothetical protein
MRTVLWRQQEAGEREFVVYSNGDVEYGGRTVFNITQKAEKVAGFRALLATAAHSAVQPNRRIETHDSLAGL